MSIFLERDGRSFSHGTLNTAFDIIERANSEHAMIDNLCMEWGLDSNNVSYGGITPRFARLRRIVWDNAIHKIQTESGEEELEIVAIKKSVDSLNKTWIDFEEYPKKLQRFLSLDGFSIIQDNNLFHLERTMTEAFSQPRARNEISTLLEKFNFVTTKGHLDQAVSGFTSGDWATCNGQIRSFMESLFDEIQAKLDPTHPATGTNARNALSNLTRPFLDPALNEWNNNDGKTFVNGLFKRLHPQGSHPGLSEHDDSLFRLQITMSTALMFLKRLDNRI